MAIYVTSDAHGHLRALDRALNLAQPGADDTVYVLGDMVDRGPDPLGVVRLVRSLPKATVLMGNHERMMLDALLGDDQADAESWDINGGWSTSEQLARLAQEELIDVLDWVKQLPLFAIDEIPERALIFTHAGIDAAAARATFASWDMAPTEAYGAARASLGDLRDMMKAQTANDLLWIRSPFWAENTGLVGTTGQGPVVVCGHTPSVSLCHYAVDAGNTGLSEELGHGIVVPVGANETTGNVADRICIDCAAASGSDFGAVGVVRIDDGTVFYGKVEAGE